MPVLMPLTPDGLRRAMERAGYSVIDEDEYNWLLARGAHDVPIVIPKKGRRVAPGITDAIFHHPYVDAKVRDAILEQISAEIEAIQRGDMLADDESPDN